MRLLAGAALVCCAVPVAASQPTFKAATALVRVPVSVVATNGRASGHDLTAADFRIREDGVDQRVEVLDRVRSPLSICFVIDTSASMAGHNQILAADSVRHSLAALEPSDQFSVVTFATAPVIVVPWTLISQQDRARVDLPAEGSTSLNDAVTVALGMMDSAVNPRRAIVLVTDGYENASRTALHNVVASRRQSETTIYAFSMVTPDFKPGATAAGTIDRDTAPSDLGVGGWSRNVRRSADHSVLDRLVGDSGGSIFRLAKTADSAEAAAALVAEFNNELTLGYSPARALDGKYRRIRIDVKRDGFRLRHRPGYLAQPQAP